MISFNLIATDEPVGIARVGQEVVLLLCGGDKTSQKRDINRAKNYFEDYTARSAKGRSGRSI